MADKKALIIRISPQLWNELRRLAEADMRSLNGQIEYILSDAVRKRSGGAAKTSDSTEPHSGEPRD